MTVSNPTRTAPLQRNENSFCINMPDLDLCSQDRKPGIKIIHADLFGTATMPMAAAYRLLGYKAHHGLTETLRDSPWPWIEDAAYACWPETLGERPASLPLPASRSHPYTRLDWDHLWGDKYDVATDLASPFAEAMIAAYPEAKVVIVQRDFETWWESFKLIINSTFFERRFEAVAMFVGWNVLGLRMGQAMQAVLRGWLGTSDASEMTKERARTAYEAYYARIRAIVPPEQRLEYTIGSGWAPLCEFLGKEMPRRASGKEIAFPRLNDAAGDAMVVDKYRTWMTKGVAGALAPYAFFVVVILFLLLGVQFGRYF